MPSYEENMQVVIDLRARVLDVNQADPAYEEVFEAVQALHATRGLAAKKQAAAKPIVDLASIFAPKPAEGEAKPDETKPAADLGALFSEKKDGI